MTRIVARNSSHTHQRNSGYRPAPIAERVAKGRLDKSALALEPGAVPGFPEKPAGLPPKVSAAWDHFAHHAHTMGILSTGDGAALLRLAKLKVEVDELDEDIQVNGRTYTTVTRNGDTMIRVRPQVRLRDRAELLLRNYLIEFGLTPTARSRVTRVAPKVEDTADSYFT